MDNRRGNAYLCSFCGYLTTEEKLFLVHNLMKHEKSVPFHCGECPYFSSSRANLRNHINAHRASEAYTCRICYYIASTRALLQFHMRTHYEKVRPTKRTGIKSSKRFRAPRCDLKTYSRKRRFVMLTPSTSKISMKQKSVTNRVCKSSLVTCVPKREVKEESEDINSKPKPRDFLLEHSYAFAHSTTTRALSNDYKIKPEPSDRAANEIFIKSETTGHPNVAILGHPIKTLDDATILKGITSEIDIKSEPWDDPTDVKSSLLKNDNEGHGFPVKCEPIDAKPLKTEKLETVAVDQNFNTTTSQPSLCGIKSEPTDLDVKPKLETKQSDDEANSGDQNLGALPGAVNLEVTRPSYKVFKCATCDFKTCSKDAIHCHVLQNHSERKIYRCTTCLFTTFASHRLESHVRNHNKKAAGSDTESQVECASAHVGTNTTRL